MFRFLEFTFIIFLFTAHQTFSQSNRISDEEEIRSVLMDYIDGTANGEPERIKNAFHPDLNLYSIRNDSLSVLSGEKYISYFKPGQKSERIGKIVSINLVNEAAMAEVEIAMPSRKRIYTDFMMLMKTEVGWKIIHKSFTFRNKK